MDCRALSPHQLPHTPKLYRDYVENFLQVAPFFEHEPTLINVLEYAKSLEFPVERRREVAAVLRAQNEALCCGEATLANLARLADGAVAVVTGQQVGLFSGPAYAFYKALSAIATARELSDNGVTAVPLFWMATEDHDVDEVRHVTWFHEGELLRFELPRPEEEAIPVGQIRLGPQIDEMVREAQPLLEETFGDHLRQTYVPEATYGSAFGGLFARVFEEQGLILLDPLDERLHRLAAPVLHSALEQRDQLHEKLLQRDRKLQAAGYEPQVKVSSRSTLLFLFEDGKRQAINAANGSFMVGQNGGVKTQLQMPREEWLRRVAAEPGKFSPNALLRPVIQDYLLPTVAYFGGPSEISYYAQSEVVYKELLGRMPVLLPRADFTLVDPKAVRLLAKYGLEVEDVWQGSQILRSKMYNSAVPQKLSAEFDATLHDVEESMKKLHKGIAEVDPTIQGTIARAEKRIKYQIQKLRHKTGTALDRHDKRIAQHQAFLENLLYPQKGLQSRDLCFLPFLARWGSAGLYELQKCAGVKKPGQHHIVAIP